MDHCFVNDLSK